MNIKQRIAKHLAKYPDASANDVALKLNVSKAYVYMVRKEMHDTAEVAEESQVTADARQEGGEHYKALGIEPWAVIDTWPLEQRIGYYRGNALKYTMRMGAKDAAPIEAAKAQHYLQKLLEVLESAAD
jgi:hypothetical protein